MFDAYNLEKCRNRIELSGASSGFDVAQRGSEKSGAHGTRARFERVSRALYLFCVSSPDRLLEGKETRGTILRERGEQSACHFLDVPFPKVSAEPLEIYAWRCAHNIWDLWN